MEKVGNFKTATYLKTQEKGKNIGRGACVKKEKTMQITEK